MKKTIVVLLLFLISASSVSAVAVNDPLNPFVKQSDLQILEARISELERLNKSLEDKVRSVEAKQQIANTGFDFMPFELQFEQMKIRMADQEMRINTLQAVVYQIRDRVISALDLTISLLKKLVK